MSEHTVRLAEVLRLRQDSVSVDPTSTYEMVGVRSFGRGLFARPPVLGTESSYRTLNRLHAYQVVLSRLFGWEGAVAMVPPEFDGCYVSTEFPTFDVVEEQVLPVYVRNFLAWPATHERLAGLTRGLGQRRQRVHAEDFLTLEIPLPAMDEQRRVAERLDRIRAASDALTDRGSRCDELSRAFAVSLASRPDLDDAAKSAAGWRQVRLGDVMTQVSDAVVVEPDTVYRTTGTYSFGRGLIDRGEILGAETSYKAFTPLTSDNVVLSKLNGWEGAVAVVPPGFDGSFVSSEYPTFRIDLDQLEPGYFGAIASAPWFWDRLNTAARGSMVRRRRINPAQFLDVEIWIPALERQRDVAAQLSPLGSTAAQRQRLVARIDALLPAALNEAFAGLS